MRLTEDQLVWMALAAIEEHADLHRDMPAPRSGMLRVTLAFLFERSGAAAESKGMFDDYWRAVTGPVPASLADRYGRSQAITAALNGIFRQCGYERTVRVMHDMGRMRG
jgi:hypothetical protein